MEKEIKQEQPAQELDDQEAETVSGGMCFKPDPNNQPQTKPRII